VTGVRRVSTLLAGAAAGAFAATVLLRRRRPTLAPERLDPRAQELREKLVEARNARADEDDFEAAGMAAETAAEEPAAPPPVPPRPPAEASEPERPKPGGPADEFEAMRRRVHEEGRAAAEEMRRDPESGAD
jgi:hypothetical protein